MLRRRVVGRAVVRTAAVGGVAYAAGHHAASKCAQQQYMDEQQDAQIADLQQQQQSMPQPVYQQPVQPVYQEPAPPAGLTDDDISQLKRLGELHESGVLTDAEFETAKRNILRI